MEPSALRNALTEVLEKNVGFHEFEWRTTPPRRSQVDALERAPDAAGAEGGRLILLAIDDITARRRRSGNGGPLSEVRPRSFSERGEAWH